MKKRYCFNCGKELVPPFRNPNQQYCNARECQNARRRLSQKKKMISDPDYKANQKQARTTWCERNPDYYKIYRQKNKDYTERNRILQRERNKRRRASIKPADACPVAKKDAFETINAINSGKYKLIPISDNDPMIAKMDAFIVQLVVINDNSN
ncbi:MAG: hypothetical protein OMM_10138 [Candidatus Magnetoglobus multicellularis str. Araruama]|uniref:Uncharacterized protein n=1 Tax=Candidatus Magnetoglobus multicellularis str. Araruama TaxID=890399 RepID=A0A1V1P239_9BACT|nr:MAG: hypothetical protein OMM_10138 [Candidatus Magnetoglobus multicellularis str. Araruama]